MTPQEEQLLNSLVERVNQTQLQEKDPDAEGLLNQALGRNQDALYILAQTVLVQNIALDQAKAQVAQLQQQVAQAQQQAQQQPARATSFLGGLLGHRDPAPPQPGYTPVPQPPPVYGQGYAPAGQPQYVPAGQPQFVPVGGGQPSFLRGAMQTAAGVAAGALAFEGVESVLHGIGGMGHPGFGWGGMGGGMMGGGFERPVEETVVNNYYDQPGEQAAGAGTNAFVGVIIPGMTTDSQVADRDGAQFENASYNTGGDEQANDDQGFYDNGNVDDGSGFDDGGGGGFDDGGGGFGGDDGGGGFV